MDLLEKYLDDVEYYVYNSNATWRGVKTCNESKYESKIESLLRCIVYEDDFREQGSHILNHRNCLQYLY